MTAAEAAIVDDGLRIYMLRVYTYMVLGLAVTGLAAFAVHRLAVTVDPAFAAVRLDDGLMLTWLGRALLSELKWLVVPTLLGLMVLLGCFAGRMRQTTAEAAFCGYAALVGALLGAVFMILAHAAIVRMFLVCAVAFAALGLWGSATRRELPELTSFVIMSLVGTLIASLAHAALPDGHLQLEISVAGVVVMSGLTAIAAARLKTEYIHGVTGGDVTEKPAAQGALSLYVNIANMLMFPPLICRRRRQPDRRPTADPRSPTRLVPRL